MLGEGEHEVLARSQSITCIIHHRSQTSPSCSSPRPLSQNVFRSNHVKRPSVCTTRAYESPHMPRGSSEPRQYLRAMTCRQCVCTPRSPPAALSPNICPVKTMNNILVQILRGTARPSPCPRAQVNPAKEPGYHCDTSPRPAPRSPSEHLYGILLPKFERRNTYLYPTRGYKTIVYAGAERETCRSVSG
jgi:hypothetical protein